MFRAHLTELLRAGMHVGSHGFDHAWLSHLNVAEQTKEIDHSLIFLDSLGARSDGHLVMCYPYGSYDETTLSLLRDRGCLLGVTTVPGTARLEAGALLTLNRFDTNDLPQSE